MKVLFWNTHRNPNINPIICELVQENNISIVVLAEYCADQNELICSLKQIDDDMIKYGCCCPRINLFGKIKNVELKQDADHYSIQILNNEYILCCVHLISQIYEGNDDAREIKIEQLMHDIQRIESELNTENTIIVGDFNSNPYDSACVDARYFHGIPIYDEAARKKRTVAGKEFSMFYNPMWRFLGDTKYPYGTYYKNSSKAINTYWNIFDQVIIRPALNEKFVSDNLKIITETQTTCLLDTNNHPNDTISDHLPIMFEIKEDCYG